MIRQKFATEIDADLYRSHIERICNSADAIDFLTNLFDSQENNELPENLSWLHGEHTRRNINHIIAVLADDIHGHGDRMYC